MPLTSTRVNFPLPPIFCIKNLNRLSLGRSGDVGGGQRTRLRAGRKRIRRKLEVQFKPDVSFALPPTCPEGHWGWWSVLNPQRGSAFGYSWGAEGRVRRCPALKPRRPCGRRTLACNQPRALAKCEHRWDGPVALCADSFAKEAVCDYLGLTVNVSPYWALIMTGSSVGSTQQDLPPHNEGDYGRGRPIWLPAASQGVAPLWHSESLFVLSLCNYIDIQPIDW